MALKLFTSLKQPLSATGVNLTIYPFLYGCGEMCGGQTGWLGYIWSIVWDMQRVCGYV